MGRVYEWGGCMSGRGCACWEGEGYVSGEEEGL